MSEPSSGDQQGPAAFDAAAIERRVLDHVQSLTADYEAIRIDPAYANTADFCAVYDEPPEQSANCIIVASRTGARQHVACLVQSTRRLDVNKTVRKRMEVRKASFAPPEETTELTGMVPDGVTPFALPEHLPVLVDAPIADLSRVVVGGGSRALKIKVAPAVLLQLPGAELVEGLSLPERA